MSSDYDGSFVIFNNWSGETFITVSATHYKGDSASGSVSDFIMYPGEVSPAIAFQANGDDSDYWSMTVVAGDSTYSRTKYNAGYEPEDAGYVVILSIVPTSADGAPNVQMCFPVSGADNFHINKE